MALYSSLNIMSTIMTCVKAPVTFSYNQDAYSERHCTKSLQNTIFSCTIILQLNIKLPRNLL